MCKQEKYKCEYGEDWDCETCDGEIPCPDGLAVTPEAIEIANKQRYRWAIAQFNKPDKEAK